MAKCVPTTIPVARCNATRVAQPITAIVTPTTATELKRTSAKGTMHAVAPVARVVRAIEKPTKAHKLNSLLSLCIYKEI